MKQSHRISKLTPQARQSCPFVSLCVLAFTLYHTSPLTYYYNEIGYYNLDSDNAKLNTNYTCYTMDVIGIPCTELCHLILSIVWSLPPGSTMVHGVLLTSLTLLCKILIWWFRVFIQNVQNIFFTKESVKAYNLDLCKYINTFRL